eukprot:GHVO01013448.1.p1 GENE.GHVO01013448.1~~GHVO01013448.1.p1  ORF type:complete len:354 (+),score=56.57 GHVO01013448.1:29-1090(+)
MPPEDQKTMPIGISLPTSSVDTDGGAGWSPTGVGPPSDDGGVSPSSLKYQRERRPAVSAARFDEEIDVKNYVPPVYEKTAEDRQFLRENFQTHQGLQMLVAQVDDDKKEQVIDAMFPLVVAEGKILIKQGDAADNLYIVQDGMFDIYVARPGSGADRGTHVKSAAAGTIFGEVALMYNSPRAATCIANVESKVWALDRDTFRNLVHRNAVLEKRLYEDFLENMPIFGTMNKYEICQLSDLLKPTTYNDGEDIITQDQIGDKFFVVKEGEAVCTMKLESHPEIEVAKYKSGDYFGEVALLDSSRLRKASVRASGECKVLWVDKSTFDRVLGPVVEKLEGNLAQYSKYEAYLREG